MGLNHTLLNMNNLAYNTTNRHCAEGLPLLDLCRRADERWTWARARTAPYGSSSTVCFTGAFEE